MISRLQSKMSLRVVATTLVTVLTVVLIGGVAVLTTTSLGCGPAKKLGLKGINNHCKTTANLIPVASPSPTFSLYSPPAFTPPPSPTPSPTEPAPVPSSGPGAPYIGPASAAFPPFSIGASGNGGPAVNTYPVTCRLPVYAGPPGSGGFIQYPGGTFVTDPSSAVALPSPGSNSPSGQNPGYGYNPAGMTYDRAFSRWLPVQPSLVSPDGSRYAFASTDGVYVVDVASSAVTELGAGQAWRISGVGAQGVYASVQNQGGLWLLSFSGTTHQITTSGFWSAEGGGAAYGTATSAVPQGVANTIIRVDLASGAVSDWFTRQSANSSVVGVTAQGDAVVDVSFFTQPFGSETWIAKGSSAQPLFGSTVGTFDQGTPVSDTAHGLWFAAGYTFDNNQRTNGVILFANDSRLYWMSNYGVQLAGGCS